MIRRGFWLATGAVLGVTGYRKATRIARNLTGQAAPGTAMQGRLRQPSAIQLRWRSPLALRMRSAAGAASSAGSAVSARHARPARPAERAASAAGFVRDVQEGMAEYWDLHRADIDRTLKSQGRTTSAQASAGGSEPGHREP